jgi:hypothetical protein
MKNMKKLFGTQKQWFCVIVLALVCAGAAFAQQEPAEPAAPAAKELTNALALDAFQLFKGFIATDNDSGFSDFAVSVAYERLVAPHFSIGVDMDLQFLKFDVEGGDDIDGNYFSLAAEGRYYPQADFEKFFLGTTFGYNQLSIDGKTKPENGGFTSLIVSLKMGYKLVTKNGFYVEPSLAYVLSKSSMTSWFSVPTPLGWNGGLRIGYAF